MRTEGAAGPEAPPSSASGAGSGAVRALAAAGAGAAIMGAGAALMGARLKVRLQRSWEDGQWMGRGACDGGRKKRCVNVKARRTKGSK